MKSIPTDSSNQLYRADTNYYKKKKNRKEGPGPASCTNWFSVFLMNYCLASCYLRNVAACAWGDQPFLASLWKYYVSVNWISCVIKVRTHLTIQKRFMLALYVAKSINTILVPLVSQLCCLRNTSFSRLFCFDWGKVNIYPPLLYKPIDPQYHGDNEEAEVYFHLPEKGKHSTSAYRNWTEVSFNFYFRQSSLVFAFFCIHNWPFKPDL